MRKVKPTNPYQYSLPSTKVPFMAPDVITKVLPAPVDGWDAISPLAEMDPKRAPILINWVPRPGYVELRSGYAQYAPTGSGAPVETLMVYRPQTGVNAMFAASSTKIYDVSVASTSNATAVVTGVTNARWQYVNFNTVGGITVLQAVNGTDGIYQWNGTAWTQPSITGIPGGTLTVIGIAAQKQRLWYILENSTVVAFMPTGAIMGPIAGTQDFGLLWDKGGYMMAMADWTIDGGAGPQDYVAFISSQGQVSLYQGTDPTNAQAWSLVGTFNLPPPIGRRCILRIGSDVAIITQQGVLPISQALPFDPSADRSIAITARIQNQMAQWALLYQTNFGWELSIYPNQQLLFLNVPTITNNTAVQGVMNTLTGAWCQFQGWNANTFASYNDKFYFGDNTGNVNQTYTSANDGLQPIVADMQCAFNWMEEPGRIKRMTMVQPLLSISNVTPTISVDTDFGTSLAAAPIVSVIVGDIGVLWDVALWDVASWGAAVNINFTNWLSVQAIGHALAMRLRVGVSGDLTVTSVFDAGTFDNASFDKHASLGNPFLQVNAFNTIMELGGAI